MHRLALLLAAWTALVVPAPAGSAEAPDFGVELVLAVKINDYPRRGYLLARQSPDGQLWATPEDLEKAGIRARGARINRSGLVKLSDLNGVTYLYDEPTQRIDFEAVDEARVPHVLSTGGRKPIDWNALQSNPAFTLNYTFYGGAEFDWDKNTESQWIASSFDTRFSSAMGVVSNTAVARVSDFGSGWKLWESDDNELVRLDSTWDYFDPERALSYRLGDTVSNSPLWGTSYRLGGLQFSRNFSIRPDLVTAAVPEFSGSAMVPSTLDIYLNNIRVYTGDIPAGPFQYSSLPFLSGAGQARIVTRDELGREIVTDIPYYVMPGLLRQGLFDFSMEAGFPRDGYGKESFDYLSEPVFSASGRYAFSNRLTGEAHFKTFDGLLNGGVGAVASLGSFGGLHLALLGSYYDGLSGGRVYARFQGGRGNFSYYLSTERAFGDYLDIGALLWRIHEDKLPTSARARAIDRAGIVFPLGFDKSSLSLGWSRVDGAGDGDDGHYLNASWSRTLTSNMSLHVSGYGKANGSSSYGVYAGLSISLGQRRHATANAYADKHGMRFGATYSKAADAVEGSVGWTVRASQDTDGNGYRGASGTYRTSVVSLSGSVEQSGSSAARVTGTVEGSLVAAGGGIFAARRVSDSFAIVNTGVPGVGVTRNGRRIATSNRSGRALIANLESFNRNRIGLDPVGLPLEMEAEVTNAVVVPNYRSGVVVDFGVRKVQSATVTVFLPDGSPVPVGSVAARTGTIDNTVAGYDGEIYLTGLSAGRNEVKVTLPGGSGCSVFFDYVEAAGPHQKIGPLECR